MKIDTSTTKGKMAVMQAFDDGEKIECYTVCGWVVVDSPLWEWGRCGYRVEPQTVEEAAEEHCKKIMPYEGLNSNEWVQQYFIAGAKWRREQDNER